jgi:hypothetical protein
MIMKYSITRHFYPQNLMWNMWKSVLNESPTSHLKYFKLSLSVCVHVRVCACTGVHICVSWFHCKKIEMCCFFFQPQTLQLDFLTKVLPNYHHLKKPPKKISSAWILYCNASVSCSDYQYCWLKARTFLVGVKIYHLIINLFNLLMTKVFSENEMESVYIRIVSSWKVINLYLFIYLKSGNSFV